MRIRLRSNAFSVQCVCDRYVKPLRSDRDRSRRDRSRRDTQRPARRTNRGLKRGFFLFKRTLFSLSHTHARSFLVRQRRRTCYPAVQSRPSPSPCSGTDSNASRKRCTFSRVRYAFPFTAVRGTAISGRRHLRE